VSYDGFIISQIYQFVNRSQAVFCVETQKL